MPPLRTAFVLAAAWLVAAPATAQQPSGAFEAARIEMDRGRALLAGPNPSRNERLRALWAFRRATEISPRDPEAWYQYGVAGFRFGNADGEIAARDGLRHVIDIDPLYRDAWQHWLILYRTDGERRDMRARLGRHSPNSRLHARIARLLIEEGRYQSADSVLALALAADSANGSLQALAAQAAFEDGRAAAGERAFGRALAFAGSDPEDVLWTQALGVASAAEMHAWRAGVAPDARAAWFRAFWWRRSSDLFAGIGGRVREHFQRLRLARRQFALTQPLFDYQRNPAGRRLHSVPSTAERVFYDRCEARWFPGGPSSMLDQARAPDGAPAYDPINPDVPGHLVSPQRGAIITFGATRGMGQLDSGVAIAGISAETGLDDRGLLLLRHGVPRSRSVGSPNTEDRFCILPSLEHWEYDDLGTVRFFRPEDVVIHFNQGDSRNAGSVVMRPMNDRQFEAARDGFATDRTSTNAALGLSTWFASFPTADAARNRVYAIASRDTIAMALTGAALIGPVTGQAGIASVEAPVDRYFVLVHAREGTALGRISSALTVRSLGSDVALSDPLLAEGWSSPPRSREDMLEHAARSMRFQIGRQMRVYAEIVRRDQASLASYRVRYELLKTERLSGDPRLEQVQPTLRAEYAREVATPSPAATMEWVDITVTPELEPGSYLLRLTILNGAGSELGRSHAVMTLFR